MTALILRDRVLVLFWPFVIRGQAEISDCVVFHGAPYSVIVGKARKGNAAFVVNGVLAFERNHIVTAPLHVRLLMAISKRYRDRAVIAYFDRIAIIAAKRALVSEEEFT